MVVGPSVVALIPARAGSERVPDKNIRPLAGHPLIAYTIAAAIQSGVFDAVVVSTDSASYAEIAAYYGAEVPFLRATSLAGSQSPDIEWIEFTLQRLKESGRTYDCFSILRPTSPFREAETIQRAWRTFRETAGIDSLRAVEKCSQHPGKMWVIRGQRLLPLIPVTPPEQPWHSSQYQSLPEVYVQNASLEIAWSRLIWHDRTIAGVVIAPFVTRGYEGFDINQAEDWWYAEHLIEQGEATPITVKHPPYPTQG